MPFADYEDFAGCVRANGDKDDPEAYCAAVKRKVEGAELTEGEKQVLAESECPDGQVSVNGECVDVETVEDVPPSILNSAPRVMASASPLDTQPIEREELGGGMVAYRGLKLVAEGVWTDSASQTPTLYDERTFENTEPDYDDDEYDGPPVNIAHDIHKDGPNAGDPHKASIGGYIDPKSLETDGTALFGDIILNTNDSAGAFADDNLKSALENDGTAGFSPSVELMPTELEEADHPRAEEYVAGAELTGLGLVRDPASKSVDLQHETQNRAVAMGASGKDVKTLHREEAGMSTKNLSAEEVREILERFGMDVGDMDDDELMDMAEDLHEDLTAQMEGGDDEEPEEGQEMEDGEEEEEEEEEEEDTEMAEGGDEIDAMQDMLQSLESRLEDLEDAMSDKMGEEEVEQELSALKKDLADAETVEEVDERLKTLEDQPKESKTLADGSDTDDGFTPTYDDSPASPSSW